MFMGKGRLVPIREISIPKLKLTASVNFVRLSKIIRLDSLKFVLKYINTKRFLK